jgi:hypothetical protein
MKFNSIAFVAFLVASAQAAPKDHTGGLSSLLGNRVIKFECKNGLMVMIFSFGREKLLVTLLSGHLTYLFFPTF